MLRYSFFNSQSRLSSMCFLWRQVPVWPIRFRQNSRGVSELCLLNHSSRFILYMFATLNEQQQLQKRSSTRVNSLNEIIGGCAGAQLLCCEDKIFYFFFISYFSIFRNQGFSALSFLFFFIDVFGKNRAVLAILKDLRGIISSTSPTLISLDASPKAWKYISFLNVYLRIASSSYLSGNPTTTFLRGSTQSTQSPGNRQFRASNIESSMSMKREDDSSSFRFDNDYMQWHKEREERILSVQKDTRSRNSQAGLSFVDKWTGRRALNRDTPSEGISPARRSSEDRLTSAWFPADQGLCSSFRAPERAELLEQEKLVSEKPRECSKFLANFFTGKGSSQSSSQFQGSRLFL